jgi:hypothetical protein
MLGMVFRPAHSFLVCPRHVQVTVSQPRGVHYVLTNPKEWNDAAPLRSRLHRDRRALARLQRVRIVMLSGAESNPTHQVNPPPCPNR